MSRAPVVLHLRGGEAITPPPTYDPTNNPYVIQLLPSANVDAGDEKRLSGRGIIVSFEGDPQKSNGEVVVFDVTNNRVHSVNRHKTTATASPSPNLIGFQPRTDNGAGIVGAASMAIDGQDSLVIGNQYELRFGPDAFVNSVPVTYGPFTLVETVAVEPPKETTWIASSANVTFAEVEDPAGTFTITNTSGTTLFFTLRQATPYPATGGTVTWNVTNISRAGGTPPVTFGLADLYAGLGYFASRYSDYEALSENSDVGKVFTFTWGPDDYVEQPVPQFQLGQDSSVTFTLPTFA